MGEGGECTTAAIRRSDRRTQDFPPSRNSDSKQTDPFVARNRGADCDPGRRSSCRALELLGDLRYHEMQGIQSSTGESFK